MFKIQEFSFIYKIFQIFISYLQIHNYSNMYYRHLYLFEVTKIRTQINILYINNMRVIYMKITYFI